LRNEGDLPLAPRSKQLLSDEVPQDAGLPSEAAELETLGIKKSHGKSDAVSQAEQESEVFISPMSETMLPSGVMVPDVPDTEQAAEAQNQQNNAGAFGGNRQPQQPRNFTNNGNNNNKRQQFQNNNNNNNRFNNQNQNRRNNNNNNNNRGFRPYEGFSPEEIPKIDKEAIDKARGEWAALRIKSMPELQALAIELNLPDIKVMRKKKP